MPGRPGNRPSLALLRTHPFNSRAFLEGAVSCPALLSPGGPGGGLLQQNRRRGVDGESPTAQWPAFQTYADGERVDWIGPEKSERPASATTLGAEAGGGEITKYVAIAALVASLLEPRSRPAAEARRVRSASGLFSAPRCR